MPESRLDRTRRANDEHEPSLVTRLFNGYLIGERVSDVVRAVQDEITYVTDPMTGLTRMVRKPQRVEE